MRLFPFTQCLTMRSAVARSIAPIVAWARSSLCAGGSLAFRLKRSIVVANGRETLFYANKTRPDALPRSLPGAAQACTGKVRVLRSPRSRRAENAPFEVCVNASPRGQEQLEAGPTQQAKLGRGRQGAKLISGRSAGQPFSAF